MTSIPAANRGAGGHGRPRGIEVDDVGHRFGRGGPTVLDGVSLRVEPKTFVCLLGPSGCGKSTLLRMLAGLLHPERGAVTIGGEPPRAGPGALAAYQPQHDALLPWRRVIGNAALGAELAGVPREAARREAADALARFGLAEFARHWPAQLSGGMRQRVALLRTFLSPRDTVLLDEPLGALDAITRSDLHGWIQELHALRPRTTVLVTHDVEEALLLADQLIVVSARPGRVVATLDCPWPRPRSPELRSDVFVAAKATVLAHLAAGRAGGPASFPIAGSSPPHPGHGNRHR
jgi:ABC-type nitrate/sulfonate/bicarbonate transport system ATPase subunit